MKMKRRIVNIVVAIVVISVLLLSAHLLVNYFDFSAAIRSIHGG